MRKKALFGALLLVAGCATGGNPTTTTATTARTDPSTTVAASTTTTGAGAFPVTVTADNGEVAVVERPDRIVSLSSVATEILFAIGAGDQVVAVDDQSNFPPEAPMTDLSGFTPNIEAIVSYEPDLVIASYDPGELVAGLEAVGVPVILQGASLDLDGTYTQIEVLGAATGRIAEAAELVSQMQADLQAIDQEVGDRAEGLTYFHEIDDMLYSITSHTFFGQVYGMFGLVSVADEADPEGFGYPQLSSEYIVAADPDLIFLADTRYGVTAETLEERPGWDALTAIQEGRVFPLDSDVASRWGPRVVDFARSVADAILALETEPAG
ncbi:MAG TPA: ABC transporter substrate-binding protein [Acidimicrobiia bacterium]